MYNSATPWIVAYEAPLSMKFSRQEYWSGLPFPSPGDLPDSGIEPVSPAWQVNSIPLSPQGSPPKPLTQLAFNLLMKISLCQVTFLAENFYNRVNKFDF